MARFQFPMPYLAKGEYSFAPSVIDGIQTNHIHVCWVEGALTLDVTESPVLRGIAGLSMAEATFQLDSTAAPASKRRATVEP